MAKRIYSIIVGITLVIIIYLVFNPHSISSRTLLWFVSIMYTILIGSIHGVVGHGLSLKQKGSVVFYPIIMGFVFTVLVFIYVYLVLPLIIPGFL